MRSAIILDDDAAVRQVISLLLTRQHWYVLQASTAEQALSQAARHPEVELLIADVVLRSGNGAVVARQVTETQPKVLCILMSGYPAADLFDRGQIPEDLFNSSRRVRFLEKPLTFPRLLAVLKELSRQSPLTPRGAGAAMK